MAATSDFISEGIVDYLRSVSLREPDILRRLREETASLPNAIMQITPEQGQFMALLVELIGAKRTLEIGVFTGYSALSVALALPPDGRILACDISHEYTSIARRYWAEARVASKIDLCLAPAIETLDRLLREGHHNVFDFAFIDADKQNYDNYYERALQLVRPGGLIAIDNIFQMGHALDPEPVDNDIAAIRGLNRKLHTDSRISLSVLPVADGLTLARKR
ncbi:MAG TPA: class I SAM-dependent methyltransferase [Bryobacteraceae bacterium]|nr:class I SAM-dependent methyltransferase [Bryobacteraceae bacterium]